MSLTDLVGRSFVLLHNVNGHATGQTIMRFADSKTNLHANYSGPNIIAGHAFVGQDAQGRNYMTYHARQLDQSLNAGEAIVTLEIIDGILHMILDWRWLTQPSAGEALSGQSVWQLTQTP